MSSEIKPGFFSNLKNDLPASLVVFLVAVPLCLGIALASGAPLFSGIIAGIVGGIVVTLISGSNLGVSGPAAGLAVIVFDSIVKLESFEIFLVAVVLAGIIQIILGFLKAGVIGYYFPSAVIKGMLTGIGIVIIKKEIPFALGYIDKPDAELPFLEGIVHMFQHITPGAIVITLISMGILILWEQPFMKKVSIFKIIQGPLIVVVLGIVLNLVFKGNEALSLQAAHIVSIPESDSLSGFFGLFTSPDFSQIMNSQLWIVAITIAVVASLETLLSVEATDKLDPHKNITPTNRELIAQGTGNVVSGLIGGLPITQVIVRSSANIQSGGKSRASSFFHGVLLLVCVMTIPHVLNMIPLASLAAVLFIVGYKLAKPALFKSLYNQGMGQFIPFMITILGIVFADLLVGIGLGLAVAIVQILYNNYKTPYHFNPDEYEAGKPVRIDLSEDVTFLNKAGIMHTLKILPDHSHVVIDGTKANNIHPDVIEIIDDFKQTADDRSITIEVINLEDKKLENPVQKFGNVVADDQLSKSKTKPG